MNVNALVLKQAPQSVTDVLIFFRHQALVAIDHRYLASKPAHRLRQFYSDVAAANHKEMLGDFVEFECFNMREWFRFYQAGDYLYRGARTRADDDVGAMQLPDGPVGKSDPDRFWSQEPAIPN